MSGQRYRDIEERMWIQVNIPGDASTCWEWQGRRQGNYGRIGGGGFHVLAHRLAYQLVVGPIPDGLDIDHLCFNPPCVNPFHLEPVTRSENSRRRHARQTHCHAGHPLTPGNYYETVRKKWGMRQCILCSRRRAAKQRALRQAKAETRQGENHV